MVLCCNAIFPDATAVRADNGLAETSTILTLPSAATWLKRLTIASLHSIPVAVVSRQWQSFCGQVDNYLENRAAEVFDRRRREKTAATRHRSHRRGGESGYRTRARCRDMDAISRHR